MDLLEKSTKGLWAGLVVLLLILPLGIPVLIVIGFIKAIRNKKDER